MRTWCVLVSLLYISGVFSVLPPVVYIPGSPDVGLRVEIVGEVQPPKGCPHSGSFLAFDNHTFQGLEDGACFYYFLSIIYDAETQSFANQTNVTVSVVLPSDGDGELYPSMQKMGYQFGTTYFLSVYDWRLSPNLDKGFLVRTQELIETAYKLNANQKVYLIGHSTGGGMTLGFLYLCDQEWKNTYLAAAITLSGNLAGELDIFGDLTVPLSQFDRVSANFSRSFWWTQPAEAWQLPHPGIYPPSQIVIKTPSKNYSTFDALEVLQQLNATPMSQWYSHTYLFNVTGNFTFPKVDFYCLWGQGLPTIVGYEYHVDDFSKDPIPMLGDGDADQDIITNSACLRWKDEDLQNYTFVGQGFERVPHWKMTSNHKVMEMLMKILQIE